MARAVLLLVAVSVAMGLAAYLLGVVFNSNFLTSSAWLITVGGLVGGGLALISGRRKGPGSR